MRTCKQWSGKRLDQFKSVWVKSTFRVKKQSIYSEISVILIFIQDNPTVDVNETII